MTVSRLIFKLLYPFCCSDTKIILGNMDAKAEIIQRCIDDKLKDDATRTWDFSPTVSFDHSEPHPDNFGRWLEILEVGTFNPVEQIAIKAALYDYKRAATKQMIYSTLVDGEFASEESDWEKVK